MSVGAPGRPIGDLWEAFGEGVPTEEGVDDRRRWRVFSEAQKAFLNKGKDVVMIHGEVWSHTKRGEQGQQKIGWEVGCGWVGGLDQKCILLAYSFSFT